MKHTVEVDAGVLRERNVVGPKGELGWRGRRETCQEVRKQAGKPAAAAGAALSPPLFFCVFCTRPRLQLK